MEEAFSEDDSRVAVGWASALAGLSALLSAALASGLAANLALAGSGRSVVPVRPADVRLYALGVMVELLLAAGLAALSLWLGRGAGTGPAVVGRWLSAAGVGLFAAVGAGVAAGGWW